MTEVRDAIPVRNGLRLIFDCWGRCSWRHHDSKEKNRRPTPRRRIPYWSGQWELLHRVRPPSIHPSIHLSIRPSVHPSHSAINSTLLETRVGFPFSFTWFFGKFELFVFGWPIYRFNGQNWRPFSFFWELGWIGLIFGKFNWLVFSWLIWINSIRLNIFSEFGIHFHSFWNLDELVFFW